MPYPIPVFTNFLVNPHAYAGESESGPPTNRELLGASESGPTLEASAGYYQDYDGQASRSWHSHQTHAHTGMWFSWPQFELPFSLPPYGSGPEPHGTGEPFIPSAKDNDRRSRAQERPVCRYCYKSFGRVQELKRHERDIHGPRRQCPLCTVKWSRPDRIKSHLIATHKEMFAPEILRNIDALRGQRLVKFLDRVTVRSSPRLRVDRGSCL